MDEKQQAMMDHKLYETLWKATAEKMDLDILSFDDAVLVNKCKNQEDITDEELRELRRVMITYKKINEEYDIDNAVENVEKVQRIIKSESKLLEIIDNQQNYRLKLRYRVGDEFYIIPLIIKPLRDSQAINEMQLHLDLFKEWNTQEIDIYTRAINGNNVFTDEEQKIANRLARKIEEKTMNRERIIEGWNEFLARQVEFEESDLNTFEEKKRFWEKIDVNTKVSLYNKVREMLHLTDTTDEDLFLYD